MATNMWVMIGGVWTRVQEVHHRDGGQWTPTNGMYVQNGSLPPVNPSAAWTWVVGSD